MYTLGLPDNINIFAQILYLLIVLYCNEHFAMYDSNFALPFWVVVVVVFLVGGVCFGVVSIMQTGK